MTNKNDKTPLDLSFKPIRLKPILGIQPGLYLTVIYALVLLLILFLLFFLPGILRDGTYITFRTTPQEAAIWIDGLYAGSTPSTLFVKSGSHKIVIEKPFYSPVSLLEKIPGRIFASLFFPAKRTVNNQLSIKDLDGLLRDTQQEFSQWALLGKPDKNSPVPPILAKIVPELLSAKLEKDKIYQLLRGSLKNINNTVLFKDLLYAYTIFITENRVLHPGNLLTVIREIKRLNQDYPSLAIWIYYFLPAQERAILKKSAWYTHTIKQYNRYISQLSPSPAMEQSKEIDLFGLTFAAVPEGEFSMGRNKAEKSYTLPELPHIVRQRSFYMMNTEVSRGQFAQFLKENPFWHPSNLDQLEKRGLVTDAYLRGWSDSNIRQKESERVKPLNYVSYYAAKAYCDWLTEKLPPALRDYQVRLPYAQEWEWAANIEDYWGNAAFRDNNIDNPQPVGNGSVNILNIFDLFGNLWEWTDSWYFPSAYLVFSNNYSEDGSYHGAEKTVKGGAWINISDQISAATRGSQPPNWCTPFLGFRPVLIKKN